MIAAGLPGYEAVNMTGMFAPAKTPATVIRRLNESIVRVLLQPESKQKLEVIGAEVVANSPQQAAATLKGELSRMGKVIKDANIRAE